MDHAPHDRALHLANGRAATIGVANGRASIVIGALSAGLIALGSHAGGRDAGTTVFRALVLSSLLREAYVELVPELDAMLALARGDEQVRSILSPRWQEFQMLLSIVAGADVGLLVYGAHAPLLGAAIPVGTAAALLAAYASGWFQRVRWRRADADSPRATLAQPPAT